MLLQARVLPLRMCVGQDSNYYDVIVPCTPYPVARRFGHHSRKQTCIIMDISSDEMSANTRIKTLYTTIVCVCVCM